MCFGQLSCDLSEYFFQSSVVQYSNGALVTQKQYRDALKLAENISMFSKRVQYAHYRPNRSIKEDRKAWWKYLCTVVSEDQKKARCVHVQILLF